MDLYVAIFAEFGSSAPDDPAWPVAACRTPELAREACQRAAAWYARPEPAAPLDWTGDEEAGAWWTGSAPYGFHISKIRLDGLPPLIGGEPCLMCGDPTVPEDGGPLCTACEAAQELLPAAQPADGQALDEIQHMLRDPQWGVGMLEDIAVIVGRTGRDVANLPGDPPTWARH